MFSKLRRKKRTDSASNGRISSQPASGGNAFSASDAAHSAASGGDGTARESELERRVSELHAETNRLHARVDELEAENETLRQKADDPLLTDSGYQLLRGFELVPPYLDEVIGRPFMMTVASEFDYREAPDARQLDARRDTIAAREGESFHNFRDEFRPKCSFRAKSFYATHDYYMNTPKGRMTMREFIFPSDLESGVEITSQFRSALYLALHHRSLQSAVLPSNVFGAPLLSYAFPVFDGKGVPIGAVSFSNDISHVVEIARELNRVVADESDQLLEQLANTLKDGLSGVRSGVETVRDHANSSRKAAKHIRRKGQDVTEIAEQLKMLALNTAIEASKVGGKGDGVSVIADRMRSISESTRVALEDIHNTTSDLEQSSRSVVSRAEELDTSSAHMLEESSVLFDTSMSLSSQKDKLTSLVRASIEEITENKDDLKAVFDLISEETATLEELSE